MTEHPVLWLRPPNLGWITPPVKPTWPPELFEAAAIAPKESLCDRIAARLRRLIPSRS